MNACRTFLRLIGWLLLCLAGAVQAGAPLPRITVAVPGPTALSYLPIDLIPRIGADRAEGFVAHIQFTDGGGKALEALKLGNVDIAVAGMPAAMDARLNGMPIVTFAAVNDLPLFVLMARKDLQKTVRSPADLRGRIVGVNTSAAGARTTSMQIAELVVRVYGVDPAEVRYVSAGQSWATQSAALRSGTVDALMGDEPFASRLRQAGEVFFLFNLSNPQQAKRLPGAGFLHAAAHVRSDTAQNAPDIPAAFSRALRRALTWIATHEPHEVTARLGLSGVEATSLEAVLAAYPHAFSRNGMLSAHSLAETASFFRATHAGNPAAQTFAINSMVDTRWSESAP